MLETARNIDINNLTSIKYLLYNSINNYISESLIIF